MEFREFDISHTDITHKAEEGKKAFLEWLLSLEIIKHAFCDNDHLLYIVHNPTRGSRMPYKLQCEFKHTVPLLEGTPFSCCESPLDSVFHVILSFYENHTVKSAMRNSKSIFIHNFRCSKNTVLHIYNYIYNKVHEYLESHPVQFDSSNEKLEVEIDEAFRGYWEKIPQTKVGAPQYPVSIYVKMSADTEVETDIRRKKSKSLELWGEILKDFGQVWFLD